MSAKRKYHLVLHWIHPKWGPQMQKATAEATSIRRALNATLLLFFRDKNNRQRRRAAHAQLEVKIWREKKNTAP